jgi:anaerobic magnesium-protoporphyrin IX monomethyl ester cyclase
VGELLPGSQGRIPAMTDCLIIGFNDSDFNNYVAMVRSMGGDSGAYRDLNLAFIEIDNEPYRSMDILNRFCHKKKGINDRPLNNTDFLWPTITYLGTYLSRRGFGFDYINLFQFEKELLRRKLTTENVLTVAITTTLYVSPHPILEIVSFIKECNSAAKIIVGGPYIYNLTKMVDPDSIQEMFRYLGADFYVINQEGEFALANIIDALKGRQTSNTANSYSFDHIDNIAYRRDGRYVITSSSIEQNPLEENMVDYKLFSKEDIGEFVSLYTAKSCPFSCSFCGFPQRAGKYKYLTVELVEKQLNELRELGTVTTLSYLDDTFNVPKARFKELLQMMIRNKYEFKWNSFYRSDHGDEETIELMREAGCEGVFLGIESGSDNILQTMNKSSRRKDYLKAIPLLKKAGILTHANFIVGFPGETYETVSETIDLIEEARPDFYRAQLWYCDPVTPIWNRKDEFGVKGMAFNWSHDTMDFKTACDLVDKLFLCVQNSIWLPQNGFELWSTYYLQRKGMSLSQIKQFLKLFNTAIKEKLIHPNNKNVPPALLENIRSSYDLEEPSTVGLNTIEVYSGARYMASEQYCFDTFNNPTPISLQLLCDGNEADDAGLSQVSFSFDKSLSKMLVDELELDTSIVFLSAYSVLLSRLSGQQETVIASAICDQQRLPLPLRLTPLWGISFREFAQDVAIKVRQAADHQIYAFHILNNPYRMAQRGLSCPVFDVGYVFSDGRKGPDIDEIFGCYPEVQRTMALALKVSVVDDLVFEFSYSEGSFNRETIQKLSLYFASILMVISRDADVAVSEIQMEEARSVFSSALEADAGEALNF